MRLRVLLVLVPLLAGCAPRPQARMTPPPNPAVSALPTSPKIDLDTPERREAQRKAREATQRDVEKAAQVRATNEQAARQRMETEAAAKADRQRRSAAAVNPQKFSDQEIASLAQQALLNELNAPSTASLSGSPQLSRGAPKSDGGMDFFYSGKVTAANAYGTPLTRSFLVTVSQYYERDDDSMALNPRIRVTGVQID